jgi:hypothetical protein
VQKKAILRQLAKVRVDVDADGGLTPVMLRLEPQGEAISLTSVDSVDDRLSEVWYEVTARTGERLVLRLERETLRFELHSVETDHPEQWRNWSEV